MPYAPRRPCATPGCRELQPCPTHKTGWASRNDFPGSTKARDYAQRHRLWRIMVLARYPICAMCHRAPSTQADHIVPRSRGGDESLENGQGLCAHCHHVKTGRESRGKG